VKRSILLVTMAASLVMVGGLTLSAPGQPREHHADRERHEHEEEMDRHVEHMRGEMERMELEMAMQRLHLQEMQLHLELLEHMKQTTFDPESCALLAIGAVTDDLDIEPHRQIEVLRNMLERTRSLGVRNAIRTALKDLYLETEQPDECLELLVDMVVENDELIADEENEEDKWEDDEDEDAWDDDEDDDDEGDDDE